MAEETKCEACRKRAVWSHNRTVRDKRTKIARIMSICLPCFGRITGTK